MSCPNQRTCPLFPLFKVDSLLAVWKTYFCESSFEQCERFKRSSTGQSVPDTLLPNGNSLSLKATDSDNPKPGKS